MTNVNTHSVTERFGNVEDLFCSMQNDYNAFIVNKTSAKNFNIFADNAYVRQIASEKINYCYLYKECKIQLSFDKSKKTMLQLQQVGLERFPVFCNYVLYRSKKEIRTYNPVEIFVEFPKVTQLDTFDEHDYIIERIMDLNLQATIRFQNVQTQTTRYQVKPVKFSGILLEGVRDAHIPGLPENISNLSIRKFDGLIAKKIGKIFINNINYIPLVVIFLDYPFNKNTFDQLTEFNPGFLREDFLKVNPHKTQECDVTMID